MRAFRELKVSKPDTMLRFVRGNLLRRDDISIICASVRNHGSYPDCHPGLLPFIRVEHVAECVRATRLELNANGSRIGARRLAEILCTLGYSVAATGNFQCFSIQLSDAKVYKKFGSHPERGVAIPDEFVKCEYTEERQLFGRSIQVKKTEYIPPTVSLQRVNKDSWEVKVASQYREKVALWLIDTCR